MLRVHRIYFLDYEHLHIKLFGRTTYPHRFWQHPFPRPDYSKTHQTENIHNILSTVFSSTSAVSLFFHLLETYQVLLECQYYRDYECNLTKDQVASPTLGLLLNVYMIMIQQCRRSPYMFLSIFGLNLLKVIWQDVMDKSSEFFQIMRA